MKTIIKYTLIYLAFLFVFLPLWLERKFGSVSLSQLVYHANYFSDGLFMADPDYVSSFIRSVLLAAVYATFFALFLEVLLYAKRRKVFKQGLSRCFSFVVITIGGRIPTLRLPSIHRSEGLPLRYSFLLFFSSFLFFLFNINAVSSIKNLFAEQPDYFGSMYIDPANVPLKHNQPKNLVLIYVESLEGIYAIDDVVGKNLLSPLTRLEEKPGTFRFDALTQMGGTGWTIAGIVSSQCGVPLKMLSLFDGNKQGEQVSSFLPNATCLGDILSRNGYKNVFMRGASMEFAGTDKFLKSHGYTELYGREEWLDKGYQKHHFNSWGLYDDDLFYEARLKLNNLMQEDQLFNLTILTVDMHPPQGFISKECGRMGFRGFEGIIECTALQIADFIDFIEKNGWSEDIQVVVMGDHLAFSGGPLNPKFDILSSERSIFNLFLSEDETLSKTRDLVTHFDIFPTILEFIGFHIPHGRLGLGYSGLDNDNVVPPKEYFKDLKAALGGISETYKALWQPISNQDIDNSH